MKEIKVTCEDFNELKRVVEELTKAQQRTEASLQELTKVQGETEQRLQNEIRLLTRQVGALSDRIGFIFRRDCEKNVPFVA